MGYMFGNFIDRYGRSVDRSPNWEDTFKFYYSMVTQTLLKFNFTQKDVDDYYTLVLKDMLCHKKIRSSCEDDRLRVFHHCVRALTNIFQILPFTQGLYELNQMWDQGNDPIGMLKTVYDMESFYEWERLYAVKIPTNRVVRKQTNLIEQMLSETFTEISAKPITRPTKRVSSASLTDFWSEL